jgi:hypothetical protein
MTESDDVEILRVNGTINAEPVLAALRANGIPAVALGEAVGRVYGLTLNGLGVVTIVVPRQYEAQARELLAAGELRQLELRDGEDVDQHGTGS